jgi:adenine-specific DNA-methyltransferase
MRYIGSKKLLLGDIERVIDENINSAESFCDIFSGTVCVGNYFKKKYKITTNDLLYFSYCIQKSVIENNEIPKFKKLEFNPIEYFNSLTPDKLNNLPHEQRFCVNNFSPAGGRMYLSEKNALKTDYIRNTIENWRGECLINDSEYYYLIAVLIEAIPFVSNISGTYGAYNKFWDKRSLKDLILKELEISDNGQDNKAFNLDGNELIKQISGDILYIDPPYNKRQYSSNYHLLETVAKYDFPTLKGVTGLRENEVKSDYCKKNSVLNSFEDLIKNAKFKHIIMSYNTEGLMGVNDIEKVLRTYGKNYKMYEIDYRRFKSRDKCTQQGGLKELIFYIRK